MIGRAYFFVRLGILGNCDGALSRDTNPVSRGGGSKLCREDDGCKTDLKKKLARKYVPVTGQVLNSCYKQNVAVIEHVACKTEYYLHRPVLDWLDLISLVLIMRLCHSMPSVRLSVTFRYCDHIGWNTSNIISRHGWIATGLCTGRPQQGRSGSTETPPKLGWNRGGVTLERKKTAISLKKVQYRPKVTTAVWRTNRK